MKMNFRFDTEFNKIKIASPTRMLEMLGEGESEIKNQGRSDHSSSFSQETGAIGQRSSRNGDLRPKQRELSAWMHADSDSTPLFLFSKNFAGAL
jgi:hypothetical protein